MTYYLEEEDFENLFRNETYSYEINETNSH